MLVPNVKPVRTKADFVRRYAAGEFGNRAPTWNTMTELLSDGYNGLIHIRNRVAGGPTWYNVPGSRAYALFLDIIMSGVKEEDLYFSAMAPEDIKIFQGEVFRGIRGYSLFYSCLPLPMREGLAKDGRQVYGSVASYLLNYYLCPRSLDWLHHLFDTYDEHVIEFSTYDREWGTDPGYNTVFWEVRQY